jgi:hypothetical protein
MFVGMAGFQQAFERPETAIRTLTKFTNLLIYKFTDAFLRGFAGFAVAVVGG